MAVSLRATAFAGLCLLAIDATAQAFAPAQISKGGELYARNCASCHGRRMANPDWAIDLKTFPTGEQSRFVNSVTNGKNSMPPWGDVFSAEEILALWAYVVAGEPRK
jgi:mono/diheme cytochrome c family protein